MSFSPLPATFLEDLKAAAGRPLLELGSGDGRFSAVLRGHGARPWRLDRRPPWSPGAVDLVADALALPIADGSVALLAAANLLRHVWPPADGAGLPAAWRRCLAPDGRLWIFEDEPVTKPRAARHYRDAMMLLARLDPRGRRPLLPLGAFLARLGEEGRSPAWRHGMAANGTAVDDPAALARLLAGVGGDDASPGPRLAAAILRDGLSYGPFWWARWDAGAAA